MKTMIPARSKKIALGISAIPLAIASVNSLAAELEEVVVTANRVETSAQDTAVALTAYTGSTLAESGISNVIALQNIDPSINVTTSNGAAYVAIRGIASTDVTETGDPSVSIARDGFFTNRSFGVFANMYDLQRVEVLKGPQGTLFGRNSTGGLINIITNRPSDELEGKVALEVGNYNARNIEAMLNVPITEKVQARISGINREHDGYRKLEPVGQRSDDEDNYSWRAQLAFQPTETLDGWISYQKDRVDQVGDTPFNGPLETKLDIDDIDTENYTNYSQALTELDGERTRWEVTYSGLPGDIDVTYSGGIDKQDWAHRLDGTDSGTLIPAQFVQNETPDTTNHEIRFATPQDKAFTAQFGYFYFKEENTIDSGLLQNGGPYAGRYLIKFDYEIETESKAYFAHLGYQINDQFKITAGARNTDDKKERTGNAVLDLEVATFGFLPFKITTPGNGNIDNSQDTYHVGLEWTPSEDTLVYLKRDTGYKGGGFNSNGSAPSINYDPEEVTTWEIGTKNDLFSNRLQLNAALYTTEYEGYQASQSTEVISGESAGVFNVGSATINGLEVQVLALVGDNGRFDLNATYLDATFDNLDDPIVDGAGNEVDISGNDLPNAPDLSFTLGYEHVFPLGNQGELTAKVDAKYSSSFYYSAFNTEDLKSPSYTTGNVSLSYAPGSYNWQLQAYVRNVTDEDILANAARNYVAHWNTYQFQPPRTYGVRFTYNFK
ncbi:TonB-dependent receptor [Parahaliea maris]|uniref:TonB-dependent receptor n=1 Tax=Parahaliea maris TaxID=2716870 RepID=A0A5C8ZTS0_9GAMM|nr:TonB-dependent receptor [Parahaliea maris]TXS91875.1 TonB-dependent receptor [Parahaliea maris]